MTTAAALTPTDLPALRPGTSGTFATWIAILKRWLRTSALSVAEEALLAELEKASRDIGATLLSATSRADLDDRIERVIMTPAFQRLDSAARLVVLAADAPPEPRPNEIPPRVLRVLGQGPAAVMEAGIDLQLAIVSAVAQLAASGRAFATAPPDLPKVFVLPGVHSTVLAGVFSGLRAAAASFGVFHAIFEDRALEPWIALALSETFRDGTYAYLRVLASLPGVSIPESVVPSADRYDLAQLERDALRVEAALDELGDGERCEVP